MQACIYGPKNWNWFRADKIYETLPPTLQKATAYINKHIELAIKLGKPVVLGNMAWSVMGAPSGLIPL
jgi:hypothetical protein